MLIDLHTHTYPASWDSDLTPDALVELSKAAGLDGVCLTEHDYFWDPAEVQALAEKHDFLVLPGVEVNTEEGHILAYGLEKYEYGMHRIGQLAEMLKTAGGAMVVAHPYRRYMTWYDLDDGAFEQALQRATGNAAYGHCVALEKIHGRATPQQNVFSERLCQLLHLPGTAGSDAHRAANVGRCATRFQRQISDIHDLITELKAGRFQAVDLAAQVKGERGQGRQSIP
jgi:predicted metal-dependent phosphoesterase TrpH